MVLSGWSCNNEPAQGDTFDVSMISTEERVINSGRGTFMQDCSACHNFIQDGIGPHLGGVTARRSYEWLKQFIANPKAMVDAGDEDAVALYERYKVYMPTFGMYSEDRLDAIIAFLHSKPAPAVTETSEHAVDDLMNPIEEEVQFSGIVVDLEYKWTLPPSSENIPVTRLVKMDFIPGTDRLFIADLRGRMYELTGDTFAEYLDMNRLEPDFIHKPGLATGFGSFTFHPEFEKNGLFYTTHTEPARNKPADFMIEDSIETTLQWVLTERKVNDPQSPEFEGTSRELFRIDMATGIHGMQEIRFNNTVSSGDPDYGNLYVCLGDGGSVGRRILHLTQDPSKPWGAIARINPSGNNSRNGMYGIPSDNPDFGDGNPTEVYAYGFRNPHRIIWDRQGKLIVSGIGQHRIEELNVVEPGLNYGWPRREGTFVIDPMKSMTYIQAAPENDDPKYTVPALQFDHDEANAISGGYVYDGDLLTPLKGKYVFGGIVRGRLFLAENADLKVGETQYPSEWKIRYQGEMTDLQKLCNHDRVDLRFGQDHEGELYIFTKADGKVYKLVSAEMMDDHSI